MISQAATIKVWCRAEQLDATATMLSWAIGHRVEIERSTNETRVGCLLIFTDIEYYENDDTILDRLGLNIIGKINGVVSWEVLPRADQPKFTPEILQEDALIDLLRTLPVPIAIMRRDSGEYAWKCMSAYGIEATFISSVEAALKNITRSYKLIRSELIN